MSLVSSGRPKIKLFVVYLATCTHLDQDCHYTTIFNCSFSKKKNVFTLFIQFINVFIVEDDKKYNKFPILIHKCNIKILNW